VKRLSGVFLLSVLSVAAQQQAPVATAPVAQAAPPAQPQPDAAVIEIQVPKKRVRPIRLPPNSIKALAMSQDAINTEPEARQDKDGRIVFTFGKGLPTVICAPYQVCEIDFEPGETVAEESLDAGDAESLKVSVKKVGTGAAAFSYLVVKPVAENVSTTMTIGTDRRVYYIRVLSMANGGQFMPRVAFYYPEEEAARLQAAVAAAAEKEKADAAKQAAALEEKQKALAAERAKAEASRQAAIQAAAEAAAKVVRPWKYKLAVHGSDAHFLVPTAIGDDGVHTHIQLTNIARTRGLPVIQIRDASGPIPANYKWNGDELVVDAIFEDGCLLHGVGRKQQRVCIHNLQLGKYDAN
jgi:type IV secretory pathway VirB9-like protein